MIEPRRSLILLVEDDVDRVDLTLHAFKRSSLPIELTVARDGQEALDYLHGIEGDEGRARAIPDLVLLDLGLPRVDGFEVLRQIRSNRRLSGIPVIVLTSSCEDRDIETSYTLGANSFLQKPVDFQRFMEETRVLAQYWLGMNVSPRAR